MYKIIAGNDFRLIVAARKSQGANTETIDLGDVEDLTISLTKAGRSKMLLTWTLDTEGRAVIYISGNDVSSGVYGVEMRGVYEDANVRAHAAAVFMVADHGCAALGGMLIDYSVDMVLMVIAPASAESVAEMISSHNASGTSHEDIRTDIAELQSAIGDPTRFGRVDDVLVDGVSTVANKIANIDLTGKQDNISYENETLIIP